MFFEFKFDLSASILTLEQDNILVLFITYLKIRIQKGTRVDGDKSMNYLNIILSKSLKTNTLKLFKMKRLLLLCFWAGLWNSSFSQIEISPNELYSELNENIKVYHSPTPTYLKAIPNTKISLNGTWKFCEHAKDSADIAIEDKNWKDIPVPSEWYMEGYKVEPNSWAVFTREFTGNQQWTDHEVLLKFGAVESECRIYVNDEFVGHHLGSMTQFEFPISKLVKSGTNRLTVLIRSESIASRASGISHYAKHQVGGILRNIDLIVQPKVYVRNWLCRTDLSEDLKTGVIYPNLEMSSSLHNYKVEITVAKKGVFGLDQKDDIVLKKRYQNISDIKEITIKDPELWHSENPFLYTISVSFFSKRKEVFSIKKDIGFKRVQVLGNILLVNGKQVRLKGVNRHDITPYEGRAIKDASSVFEDIRIFRDGNCNFVRTSHYPPSDELVDACDKLGVFIEVEAPVCWDARKPTKETVENLFYCYKSMLYRNISHPSVIIWSIANESDWAPKFELCRLLSKKVSPNIPVKFSHSETHGIIEPLDIGTKHYPGWKGLMAFKNYHRPIIFGEALHLNCYNRSELATDPGLRDRWGEYLKFAMGQIEESPSIIGLAIWSGVDEVFYPKNKKQIGYGAWGVIDGFRREKPEFWHMKMAFSPITVDMESLTVTDENIFLSLRNKYQETNLRDIIIEWKDRTQTGYIDLNVPASEARIISIPHKMQGDTLHLTFKDPRGFTVSEWAIPRKQLAYTPMQPLKSGKVAVTEDSSTYSIKSKTSTFVFSKETGQLISISKNGTILTENPVQAYIIPHLFEEEVVNNIPQNKIKDGWFFNSEALTDWTLSSLSMKESDFGVIVSVKGNYGKTPFKFKYNIDSDDRLRIDYITNIFSIGDKIHKIGLGLILADSFNQIEWNANSLWSVYPDNHIGRPKGKAKAFYSGTLSNYLDQRVTPLHPYSEDGNQHGSNDFRSTKHYIRTANISSDENKITIESNGLQHFRAWIQPRENNCAFIVAGHSDAGNEFYLNYESNRTRYLEALIAEDGDVSGWAQLKF